MEHSKTLNKEIEKLKDENDRLHAKSIYWFIVLLGVIVLSVIAIIAGEYEMARVLNLTYWIIYFVLTITLFTKKSENKGKLEGVLIALDAMVTDMQRFRETVEEEAKKVAEQRAQENPVPTPNEQPQA